MKKFFSSAHFITILFFCTLCLLLFGAIIDLPSNQTLKEAKASVAPAPTDSLGPSALTDAQQLKTVEIFDITGEIETGDSLNKSFDRCGVPSPVRIKLIDNLSQVIDFRKLRPGDRYSIKLDDDEKLIKCVYEVSPLESYTLTYDDAGYKVERDKKFLETRKIRISGLVENTLFDAFPQDIKTPKLVYAFADIFSSRIDFNTEIRVGDHFSLVVEEYYLFGEFVGYGPILAGNYERANGELFEAFRYNPEMESGSSSYYDQEGRELGSSFIRSPVGIGRVSSRFTTRRKHPILGTVRPHLGVDLAAPTGTPVMAAADGKVEFIGRNGGYGKQIIIEHGNGYRTHYGHLSGYKKGLKLGQKVKQKQIIGYVGSTGLSTGPHLDYRVQHYNNFQNPFSLKYRPKSVLSGEKLAKLRESITPMIAELYDDSKPVIEVGSLVVEKDNQISFL